MTARKRTNAVGGVAVTGAGSGLGRLLVDVLRADPAVRRVLAVDRRPDGLPARDDTERVVSHRIDLADPSAGPLLAEVFQRRGITTVVHADIPLAPSGDAAAAHEHEVIGTLQLLTACAQAGTRRLVMVSTTLGYGAAPSHPNHLSESMALQGAPGFAFVQDKLEAEAEVTRFCAGRKVPALTVLRLCPTVGPGLDTMWGRYLRLPAAPTALGFDPLVQFLHPSDAIRAIRTAVHDNTTGVFNIVGRGVVPLSTALRMAGTVELPLPRVGVRALLGALWATGRGPMPPQGLDYLCHPCVADGEHAAQSLGFIPQYGVHETLVNLVGVPAPAAESVHG